MKICWIAIAALILASCGGPSPAQLERDRVAKQLRPWPGRALVYVYASGVHSRGSHFKFVGDLRCEHHGAWRWLLDEDEYLTSWSGYYVFDVPEGVYHFEARTGFHYNSGDSYWTVTSLDTFIRSEDRRFVNVQFAYGFLRPQEIGGRVRSVADLEGRAALENLHYFLLVHCDP